MPCSSCSYENRAGARFCVACGAMLTVACRHCGAKLPADARFCDACGQGVAGASEPSVSEPTTAPDAERRQLTVMFCDLVGSTPLAEQLDPEDLRDVVRAYQETCAGVVRRFEGYLAKYLGDGLLIHFGYPVAHEDDAERAVRAGLGIIEAMGPLNGSLDPGVRLAVRIGIDTGLVVAGEMGARDRREPLAIVGEAPNVAARLQEVAAPDAVVISGRTLRLVAGLFITEDLGSPPLKGVAHPVRVYRVLQPSGVRSRLDAAVRLTPLVGREREMGLLLDRWEQVGEGEGQAVLISGEAGLGKSRLMHAVREQVAEKAHTWLECGGSAYTRNSAFRPVIELVQRGVGFTDSDSAEEKWRRLETGLTRTGVTAANSVPLLARLLSLPVPAEHPALALSREAQRRQSLEALVAWILGLSERQPLVLLVEDLHWCDPSTLELLGILLDQIPTARVLMLLTFRPEFEPPWPVHSHVTILTLRRLRRRQGVDLIAGMTPGRTMPAAVVTRIVERGGGIPLYVEELTKTVLESGMVREQGDRYERTDPFPEFAIPSTLQGSLMARLDRLGPTKEVAQLASVLGREFSQELLTTVSPMSPQALEPALDELVAAELLYRRGLPPHVSYTFKHALIQETAYQSLLKSRRQDAHLRVAQALEERFPERVETQPEVVARHYEEANQPRQAISYYRRAGEHATERSAYAETVAHLRRAINLLPELPDGKERDREEIGLQIALGTPLIALKGYGDPAVERAYASALELCQETGSAAERFEAVWGLANYHQSRSELDTALDLARRLLGIAEKAEDQQLAVWAHLQLGATLFWRGEPVESLHHLERSIALYDPDHFWLLPGAPDPGVAARVYAGLALWQLGRPDRAVQICDEGIELGRAKAHPFSLALALCFGAMLNQLRCDCERVRKQATEAIALSVEQEFPLWRGLGKVLLGWTMAQSADGKAAIEQIEHGFGDLAATGTEVGAPGALLLLAEAQWAVGLDADALGSIVAGLEIVTGKRQHSWEAELLRLQGDILGEQRAAEAEASFRRALEVARRQQAKSLELRAAASLGRLLTRQGRKADARRLLAPILECFTEGLATQDYREAQALLGELS